MNQVLKCADFTPETFFENVGVLKNRKGNPGGKKRKYMALTTAFDIETTRIPGTDQSVMYIWQWQFGTEYTVIGRTWEEYIDLCERIKRVMPEGKWLVVYVFNLAFEFQFLKGIYPFTPDDVFGIASRKPLKCDMFKCFELRCAYRLTNMSLDEFTTKMNVEHKKLSGEEFDYQKTRYWFTNISNQELAYCINDVLGLVEAINALMLRDGDTLQTIPLTSTGYVRRNAKLAMRNGIHHNFVYSILPDYEVYTALREAFRGGNTHASRFFADDIVHNVHSCDISSSYPAVICNCLFPMTEFVKFLPEDCNADYVIRCMTIRHKALLLRVKLEDVKLRDRYWGCPYISSSKCRNLRNASETIDNGRVLSADSLEITITDVDFKIIMEEYSCKVTIINGWYSSYKKLPQPLIDETIQYYKNKTELKGIPGQEIYYDKAKALLNSLYGMMAQSSIKPKQIFRQVNDWDTDYSLIMNKPGLTDDEKVELIKLLEMDLLDKYNRKAFLAYQWGVWVTSWSRFRLEQGIKLAHRPGANFLYCDTDSVKYTGEIDWSEFNNDRIDECKESGSFATDPKGHVHYMGVFENEDNPETGYSYYEFKTLGAKKYAYVRTPGGKTECTIAGVSKKEGGAELDEYGGLSAFEDGFTFKKAGGTEAIYNDDPEVHQMEIDGHIVPITSNITIAPSEYTVGLEGDYQRILKYAKGYLDNAHIL